MPQFPPFYIYYPPVKTNSGILPEELRYRYFVKVTPEGNRLVPGVIQQGLPPKNGQWLEVGKINRDLSKRYFVKTTSARTLVAGSLIESDTHPGGRYKEIKMTQKLFHRFQITNQFYSIYVSDKAQEITTIGAFNALKVIPVLKVALPSFNTTITPVRYQLFYYQGNFEQINNDPQKLLPFSDSSKIKLYHSTNGVTGGYLSVAATNDNSTSTVFQIMPFAPQSDISISIILGILNTANIITDYIVLESLIFYQYPA